MVWRRSSWRRCVLPDATFRIVRSRRTTIAITVSAGSVVVRAPFGVSDDAIRAFVVSKRAWIDRKLEEYTAKADRLKKEYEEKDGPLGDSSQETTRWAWVSDPWPWEKEGN